MRWELVCPGSRHRYVSLASVCLPNLLAQVTVGFKTGPNGFSFDYTIACYDPADNVDCGDILAGNAQPTDTTSGELPREYSEVETSFAVRG
jgi:hypothetical protein